MQQLIKNGDVVVDRTFLGAHPAITASGVLLKGKKYLAGEVLGQVTADKKLKGLDPSASDGSEGAKAILLGDVDATESDEPCTFIVHGEAIADGLIWPEGITVPQKATAVEQLQMVGIYVD
jgi:hypothetical protein